MRFVNKVTSSSSPRLRQNYRSCVRHVIKRILFYLSAKCLQPCNFQNFQEMAARAGSKRAADHEQGVQEESGKGSKSSPSKKKPKPLEQVSKFGGMTEEEVCKMLLPDHLKPGLDVVFVSIALCFLLSFPIHSYWNETTCRCTRMSSFELNHHRQTITQPKPRVGTIFAMLLFAGVPVLLARQLNLSTFCALIKNS